jgi:hypothetical protein
LVFEKNAICFAKNCQKSQKIMIITSTPDWAKISPFGRHVLALGAFLKPLKIHLNKMLVSSHEETNM